MILEKEFQVSETMGKTGSPQESMSMGDSRWILALDPTPTIIQQIGNMSLGDEQPLDRWGIVKEVAVVLEDNKDPQVEKVMEARKRKFFLNNHVLTIPDDDYKRQLIDYDAEGLEVIENKLTMFGVGVLSNKELMNYFNQKIKKPQWLDNSSAVVEFANAEDLSQGVLQHLKVPLLEFEEYSNKKQYELIYYHKNVERKLVVRNSVNEDFRNVKPLEAEKEVDSLCKEIYLEREARRRSSLLSRKKFIKKERYQREDRPLSHHNDLDNSNLSFKKHPEKNVSESYEQEIADEMQRQGATENDPIELDLDFNDISVIHEENEPKVPRIYQETNDHAKFRTIQHRTKFRQPGPQRTSFCYKKYEQECKKREQALQKQLVVLDD